MRKAVVVGAGITGATAAWQLQLRGWDVTVYEAEVSAGGQLRAASLNGVLYEPHGAHIFHTDNEAAYNVVTQHATLNRYAHVVKTELPGGRLITWPPQVGELTALAEWPQISAELAKRPEKPSPVNFETYAVDLMGRTLYEWLCEGYTRKQWGMEPHLLSARFAPKRLDLRQDGDQRMFRDRWQGWIAGGWQTLVESLLRKVEVRLGERVTAANLPAADGYVITAPLDEFLEHPRLPWRGVRLKPRWYPEQVGYQLPAGVVNQSSAGVPYTRRIETKRMALQHSVPGTVICEEYPGSLAKHYPIDDAAGQNREVATAYAQELKHTEPRAVIAGRLATYAYIDTDQAIMQGLMAARKVASFE